jgi:hypothetical protein
VPPATASSRPASSRRSVGESRLEAVATGGVLPTPAHPRAGDRDHAERPIGVGERVEEREHRSPRVAADDPTLVSPVATQCVEVGHGGLDVERPGRDGTAVASLVVPEDAGGGREEVRRGAEVVAEAGPAVAEDERDARPFRGGPQCAAPHRHQFLLGVGSHAGRVGACSGIWVSTRTQARAGGGGNPRARPRGRAFHVKRASPRPAVAQERGAHSDPGRVTTAVRPSPHRGDDGESARRRGLPTQTRGHVC